MGGRIFGGAGRFDVLLLVGPDSFLHLNLFIVPSLLEEFGSEPCEVLRVFGDFVGLAGGAFADAFIVVEALAVLLLPSFDIFVLRLLRISNQSEAL